MHYILITGLTTAQAGQHTRRDPPALHKGEIAVQTPTEEPASAQDSTTDGSPEVVTVVYGPKPEGGLGLRFYQARIGDGDQNEAYILMHKIGESAFRPGLEHLEPFVGSIIHEINGQSVDGKSIENLVQVAQSIPVGEQVELTLQAPDVKMIELQFEYDDSIQILPLELSVNMNAGGDQIYLQAANEIILNYPDLVKRRSSRTISELLHLNILQISYAGQPLLPTDNLQDVGLDDDAIVNVKWEPGALKEFLHGADERMAAEESRVLRLMEQGQADDAIANTVKWGPGEVKEFIDINERKFEEQAQKIIEMKKKHRASTSITTHSWISQCVSRDKSSNHYGVTLGQTLI